MTEQIWCAWCFIRIGLSEPRTYHLSYVFHDECLDKFQRANLIRKILKARKFNKFTRRWLVKTLLTILFFSLVSCHSIAQVNESIILPEINALECGIERPVPPESFLFYSQNENGLDTYGFDTNQDGQVDVKIEIPHEDIINRYPLFYSFDRNYNGMADITYVDKRRDGTCDGIDVYWLAEVPELKNKHRGSEVDCVTKNCDKRKEAIL